METKARKGEDIDIERLNTEGCMKRGKKMKTYDSR